MKKIKTEVCAYSLESCAAALEAGASRVELCASPSEGGTTPSAGTIAMAREVLRGAELSVMIRPRGGDFLYSDTEFAQMKRDIDAARESGADCVVLGLLLPDGSVDIARTAELVRHAAPMEVTFHRAFDVSADLPQSLEDTIAAGCARVLTSGGENKAVEGIDTIRRLAAQAAGRIEIMAGSGVNPSNAEMLLDAGVDALHFSAMAVRESRMTYRNPRVPLCAAGLPEYEIAYADPAVIRRIVEIAGRYENQKS